MACTSSSSSLEVSGLKPPKTLTWVTGSLTVRALGLGLGCRCTMVELRTSVAGHYADQRLQEVREEAGQEGRLRPVLRRHVLRVTDGRLRILQVGARPRVRPGSRV